MPATRTVCACPKSLASIVRSFFVVPAATPKTCIGSTCATLLAKNADARPGNDGPAGADGDPRAHSLALNDGWLQHPRPVARQRPDLCAAVLTSRGACPNATGCRGSAIRHVVSAAAASAYGRVRRHAAAARRRASRDLGLAARGGAGEAFANTARLAPTTYHLPPSLATSYVPRTCGEPTHARPALPGDVDGTGLRPAARGTAAQDPNRGRAPG